MPKRLARAVGHAVGPFLALIGLVVTPTVSFGQLYTTDPYDPSGRPFRGYVYPRGGDEFAAGYSPRARGYVAPNQLDRYSDSLDLPIGGRGARFDSANRRFDDDFERVYRPNEKADKKYVEEREQRERDMIGAMRERDPRKRSELRREVEQESKKSASDPSLSVRRGASGSNIASAPTRRASRSTSATSKPSARDEAPDRAATGPSTSRSKPSADSPPSRTKPKATSSGGAAPNSGRQSPALRSIDRSNALPTDVLRRSRERDAAARPNSDSPAPTRPQ